MLWNINRCQLLGQIEHLKGYQKEGENRQAGMGEKTDWQEEKNWLKEGNESNLIEGWRVDNKIARNESGGLKTGTNRQKGWENVKNL